MNELLKVACAVAVCAAILAGCSGDKARVPNQTMIAAAAGDSAAAAAPALTYEQRQGEVLYRKYCATCHGDDGKGDGFNAYNLDPKPRDFTDAKLMGAMTDERIVQTITGGGRSVNRSLLMPSWGGRMSKDEIAYVAAYVRSFIPSK